MKNYLAPLACLLLLVGAYPSTTACAQVVPVIPVWKGVQTGVLVANAIAAQTAANKDIAAKTTTTATYREQKFLMKRSADDVLTGTATDRIAQLESQLALCYTALLADSTGIVCPPERQALIRANIKYIDLARPNWDQKAYRQEFKFYLAEDTRRRKAAH